MLKFYLLLTVALPLAQAARLLLTNDDGWDHPNIRALFHLLDTTTNHKLILSAPTTGHIEPSWFELSRSLLLSAARPVDQSSRVDDDHETSLGDDDVETLFGGDDHETSFRDDASEHTLVWDEELRKRHEKAWGHRWGYDISDIRLNHGPFDPKAAIELGQSYLGPMFYHPDGPNHPDGRPVLVLVGPTVRDDRPDRALAAVESLLRRDRSPTIVFATANTIADPAREQSSKIFASLAGKIIQRLIRHDKPDIPSSAYLHVSFPHVDIPNGRCSNEEEFKFILTSRKPNNRNKLNRAWGCEQEGFPFETEVVGNEHGCYVAISLVFYDDAGLTSRLLRSRGHKKIHKRLEDILKCFPKN
ncbi:hypothetical protein BDU57DRAFT_517416 [Ampelomyces quisqualis]|uniref:Survival protein SurE-like phosphatase/nucleotidase domain-containing protein n=1 Tax=Ampelomyces quisqualis TaxID=50730 RepID=A0A6A5QNL8_AMPQU|nr:hypothetical protein BDU57DRAFT_517416 [Ampelomyces quisqualis]